MNIFIDTTVTNQDPFLVSPSNNRLIDLVTQSRGKIYLSEVVIEETIRSFKEGLTDAYNEIKLKNQFINARTNNYNQMYESVDILLHERELREYYDSLVSIGLLKIIPSDYVDIREVVMRAINRLKPFSEKKQEFRDAVIWFSYSGYVKENKLDNCYFITNNVTDFYADDKKSPHEELLKDCSSILFFKNSKSVLDDLHARGLTQFTKTTKQELELLNYYASDSSNIIVLIEEEYIDNVFEVFNDLADDFYLEGERFEKYILDGFSFDNVKVIEKNDEQSMIEGIINFEVKLKGEIEFAKRTKVKRTIDIGEVICDVEVGFVLLVNKINDVEFELLDTIDTTVKSVEYFDND